MVDSTKASPQEIRAFFEADSARKVTSRELMDLKKDNPGGYDAIARGIKDGTLTYP